MKFFRKILIAFFVFGALALIIWFVSDADAKQKLADIAFGLVVLLVMGFFIHRYSKKGKRTAHDYREDQYWAERNNEEVTIVDSSDGLEDDD